MKTIRRLLEDRRGIAAVEFALVLPVLLMLMFGIIEMGMAWYYKQMLVNASREGARVGILSDTGSSSDVSTYVSNVLDGGGYPAAYSVSSSGVGGSRGDLVTVRINSSYDFPVLSSLIPAIGSVNLEAVTVMRHE